jgi:hypothetical protein
MKKILLLTSTLLLQALIYAQDSISVLFIGNSYTYVNDLPTVLGNLVDAQGDILTVDSKTNGGYNFLSHANDGTTFQKINSKPWDFVVLQGQSQEPSFPYDQVTSQSLPYVVQIADSVREANFCTQLNLFMTWGRQNGDPQWDSINTFDKMNQRLRDAYLRFAYETEGSVSPVGVVWKYVRDNYPTINLYSGDGSHPSFEGTYLAACTFYASLYQKSCSNSTYVGALDPATALLLQDAASSIVLDSIPTWQLRPSGSPSLADFELVQNGNSITTENLSLQAVTYYWEFGDEGTSMEFEPGYTFENTGTHVITLTAQSDCNESVDSKEIIIAFDDVPVYNLEEITIQEIGPNKYKIVGDVDVYFVEVYTQNGKLLYSDRINYNTFELEGVNSELIFILGHTTQGIFSVQLRMKD